MAQNWISPSTILPPVAEFFAISFPSLMNRILSIMNPVRSLAQVDARNLGGVFVSITWFKTPLKLGDLTG